MIPFNPVQTQTRHNPVFSIRAYALIPTDFKDQTLKKLRNKHALRLHQQECLMKMDSKTWQFIRENLFLVTRQLCEKFSVMPILQNQGQNRCGLFLSMATAARK